MRTGVNEFQGNRLTQVRESLAMTKVALASIVEVSPATITNWESGKQSPEASKLDSLSQALKMPVHWFLRPVEPAGDKPAFFRSMAAASKAARTVTSVKLDWMFEISSVFQQWLDWPAVKLPSVTVPYHQISDLDIEDIALETRQMMGLGEGPISDVVLAMENSGIICARDDLGFLNMDGVSKWNEAEERPYTFLANDKTNGVRSRFDAAHELGHCVLHRYVEKVDQSNIKEIERQANLFASALLLPAKTFARELRRPNLESFMALKPRWKVSIAAMVMRCYQLEIIGEREKTNLFKRISANGWRRQEPWDDSIKIETPRLFNRAATMLVEQGVKSKPDLLDDLGFSAHISESLCGLPYNYFETKSEEPINLVTFRSGARSGPQSSSTSKTPSKVVSFQRKA